MEFAQAGKIEGNEIVGVEQEEARVELSAGLPHPAAGFPFDRTLRVCNLEPEAVAVAEMAFDLRRPIAREQHDLRDALITQLLDQEFQERTAVDRNHRLGQQIGIGPHPRAQSAA